MIQFDRIVVAVPELPAAVDQYQRLFGAPPYHCESPNRMPAARWDLRNTVIELVPGAVERPKLQGVVFSTPDTEADDTPLPNHLGMDLRTCDGSLTADLRRLHPGAQAPGVSVDHLVLRTDNAQGCIDLFAGELGIRLALDKTAPQWGGRMLFFRAGKLTLEIIASDSDSSGGSQLWGLAYACQDLEHQVMALAARGVEVSAVREGRKPGTRVASVKSHCLDIPTLLIQPLK